MVRLLKRLIIKKRNLLVNEIVAVLATTILIFYLWIRLAHEKLTPPATPPPPSTEYHRIDVVRARKGIKRYDKFPEALNSYQPDAKPYPNWGKNSTELHEFCFLLKEAHGFVNAYVQETDCRDRLLSIMLEFVPKLRKRLDSSQPHRPYQALPWGSNWYHFSISLSTLLGDHLIVFGPSTPLKEDILYLITQLIRDPETTLNIKMAGVNSMYAAWPWILVRFYTGNLTNSLRDPSYLRAMDVAKLPIKEKRREEGLHRDLSFIFHRNGFYWGYLYSLTLPITLPFYYLDDEVSKRPFEVWHEIGKRILHPYLDKGNYGLLGRLRENKCDLHNETYDFGTYLTFGKYFKEEGPGCTFTMRAMREDLAFYESDEHVEDTAQYWVQFRNIVTKSTPHELQWPAHGLIEKENQGRVVLRRRQGLTVTGFLPKYAKSALVGLGRYGGIVYQEYEIEQFGDYRVTEVVVSERVDHHLTQFYKIENRESVNLYLYGPNPKEHRFAIPANTTKYFRFDLELRGEGSLRLAKEIIVEEFIKFPYKIRLDPQSTMKLTVDMNENLMVLYKNDEPYVVSTFVQEYEYEYFDVQINKKNYSFVFDSRNNFYQYRNKYIPLIDVDD